MLQLAWTATQCVRPVSRPNNVAIFAPHFSSGAMNARIAQCTVRDIVRRLAAAEPTIVVRGTTSKTSPISDLCDHLGIDACDELAVHFRDSAILVVEGSVGGRQVVVHWGVGVEGEAAIRRHAAGLAALEKADLPANIRAIVPARITTSSPDDVLVQTRLTGTTNRHSELSDEQFCRRVEGVLQLCLATKATARSTAHGPEHEFIQRQLVPVPDLIPREFGQRLHQARGLLQRWPTLSSLPSGFVHGDLWLENVLFDEANQPTGLVDWEWSRANGLPAVDALYLIFMSIAGRRGVSVAQIIPQAWDIEKRDVWTNSLLECVRQEFAMSDTDLLRAAVLVWFSILRRSTIDTTGTASGWFDAMVPPVSDSLQRHLANLAATSLN